MKKKLSFLKRIWKMSFPTIYNYVIYELDENTQKNIPVTAGTISASCENAAYLKVTDMCIKLEKKNNKKYFPLVIDIYE